VEVKCMAGLIEARRIAANIAKLPPDLLKPKDK
jgi:hypothetical protein